MSLQINNLTFSVTQPQQVSFKSKKASNDADFSNNNEQKKRIIYSVLGLAVLGATSVVLGKKGYLGERVKNLLTKKVNEATINTSKRSLGKGNFFNTSKEEVKNIYLENGKAFNADGTPFTGLNEQILKNNQKATLIYKDGLIESSFLDDKCLKTYERYRNADGENVCMITKNLTNVRTYDPSFETYNYRYYDKNNKLRKVVNVDNSYSRKNNYIRIFDENGNMTHNLIKSNSNNVIYEYTNVAKNKKENIYIRTGYAPENISIKYQGKGESKYLHMNLETKAIVDKNNNISKEDVEHIFNLFKEIETLVKDTDIDMSGLEIDSIKKIIAKKYKIALPPKKLYHMTNDENYRSILNDTKINKSSSVIGDGVFMSNIDDLKKKYPKETLLSILNWYSQGGEKDIVLIEIPVKNLEPKDLLWRQIGLLESTVKPVSQEWNKFEDFSKTTLTKLHKQPLEYIYRKPIQTDQISKAKKFSVKDVNLDNIDNFFESLTKDI